jgi:hypothetical protein
LSHAPRVNLAPWGNVKGSADHLTPPALKGQLKTGEP